MHGTDQELIFRQAHELGRIALSDFTDMAEERVTIASAPLAQRPQPLRPTLSDTSLPNRLTREFLVQY